MSRLAVHGSKQSDMTEQQTSKNASLAENFGNLWQLKREFGDAENQHYLGVGHGETVSHLKAGPESVNHR